MANSCLSYEQIGEYIVANRTGYGWHISDLVIYDKPRDLHFLGNPCPKDNPAFETCEGCGYCDNNGDCDAYIKRPPQSWQYVEIII